MTGRKYFNQALLLVLILICTWLLAMQARGTQNPYLNKAQDATFGVVSMLQTGIGKTIAPVRSSARFVSEYGSLRRENRDLSEENLAMREQTRRLKELEAENEHLRELVDFKTNSGLDLFAARVVARSVDEWQSAVVIDKGTTDGVSENMAVVDGFGLVGKTVSVTAKAAKVLLISDRRCAVGVKVRETNDFGLVEGIQGSAIPLKWLDRTSKVKVGQTLVTSGLGGVFPASIPVGKISKVAHGGLAVEKRIWVKPAADLMGLDSVMVVRNSPSIPPEFEKDR